MKKNSLLAVITAICYSLIAYVIPRSDFTSFAVVFTFLFGAYGYWCYEAKNLFKEDKIVLFIIGAVLLRCLFLIAIPELSDDFYRYLWDGRLLSHGMNPYRYIPSELLTHDIYQQANLEQLFGKLNSPDFYSVYPPLTQLLFASATFFFSNSVLGSVVLMHLIVIGFELGTILVFVKLLRLLKKPVYLAFFYAFNPLVILELSGNLHTEFCMIFFIVTALYLLLQGKLNQSAFSFAMAVCAKLLPLMFMPLILHRLWFKKGFIYCAIVGIVSILFFIPFYDLELLFKIRESMALYFAHFEFNASVYYVTRYWLINEYWHLWDYHAYFKGFWPLEDLLRQDLYAVLRKLLPVLDILLIVWFSLKRTVRTSFDGFLLSFLWIYSAHYFLATTVHPWYITTFVLFSVLTPFRYPLLWTFLIGFTYISYQSAAFAEHSWVIALEYILVFGMLFFELRKDKNNQLEVKESALDDDSQHET